MRLRPPRSTRTDTPLPYTTLCRSLAGGGGRPLVLPDLRQYSGGADYFNAGKPLAQGCGERAFVRVIVVAMQQRDCHRVGGEANHGRSEEHTSELQSLMRISYAVFCLKKKKQKKQPYNTTNKS